MSAANSLRTTPPWTTSGEPLGGVPALGRRAGLSEYEGAEFVLGGYGGRARRLAHLLYQKANDRGWASEAATHAGMA